MARDWVDVPAGIPVHHHCVVSIESSHDPKNWVDHHVVATNHVAWTYPDAVAWVHDQLIAHHADTIDAYGFRADVESSLDGYVPAEIGPDVEHHRYRPAGSTHWCPSLWERLPQTFQLGRSATEAWQLSPGRKLALQVMPYADQDQPAGVGGRGYFVCTKHARPTDQPYLGLTTGQAELAARYGVAV